MRACSAQVFWLCRLLLQVLGVRAFCLLRMLRKCLLCCAAVAFLCKVRSVAQKLPFTSAGFLYDVVSPDAGSMHSPGVLRSRGHFPVQSCLLSESC